jgi:sarcosine oxidase, subunit gamma
MPDALRRSVIDGPPMPSNGAATTTACAFATRFILRGAPEVAALIAPAFGATPPPQPLRSDSSGQRSALWLGPDEWLLIAEDSEAGLGSKLEASLASAPHALIDVSHRQSAL